MARGRRTGAARRVRRHPAARAGRRGVSPALSRPHAYRLSPRGLLLPNSRARERRIADRAFGHRHGRGGDPQQSALSLRRPGQLLQEMDSRKLALLCRELADDKKAEDIIILDLRELSSVTDYFVIASGTSEP